MTVSLPLEHTLDLLGYNTRAGSSARQQRIPNINRCTTGSSTLLRGIIERTAPGRSRNRSNRRDRGGQPYTIQRAVVEARDAHTQLENVPYITFVQRPVQVLYRGTLAEAIAEASIIQDPVDNADALCPTCTVDHDNKNLIYNRPNVPTCCKSHECYGAALPGAPGSLGIFLLPAELEAFEKTGSLPDGQIECLLCHRLTMTIPSVAAKLNRTPLGGPMYTIPPLFQNLVDVPGGYKREYIITGPSVGCINYSVSIVGISRHLNVRTNPTSGITWVDQGETVFGACPSTS